MSADENPYDAAEQLGMEVIPSTENHLQLDYDDGLPDDPMNRGVREIDKYTDLLQILDENDIISRPFLDIPSKTQGHFHRYIRLQMDIPVEGRIALQALLGSDPKAEMLAMKRVINGERSDAEHVMFETPENAKKVREFLGMQEPVIPNDNNDNCPF